jgi:putative endonuclease
MAKGRRKALGDWGEAAAAVHLERNGYCILERNARTRAGEIDLVARHGETLVFIEVKTRSGTDYGDPLEAVTPAKSRRIRRLAAAWLAEHAEKRSEIRFDVIGIVRREDGTSEIDHLPDAF